MIKRYSPLLFVVLVVIATAAVFLLFRDRDAETPAPAAAPPAAGTVRDGFTEYRVESEAEYLAALEALGTSTAEIEAWARSQGFPPRTYTETSQPPLERNYERERDERLLALAEEGDTWAMQFLATRISPEMPLEAIDWYRQAVVRGSAYSAFKLGTLYQDVARWVLHQLGNEEQVAEIAQREDPLAYSAVAWLLIAEYEASLPPGAMSATITSFHSPDEAINQACIRAAGILGEIEAERESLGIEVSKRRPPLAVELPPEEIAGYCAPEVFPRTDFSGCETIRLAGDAGTVTGHRCR